ncbi:hypothetical protein EBX93_18235 [bacterium]|nr:hypothetical protein [bacterium]
MSFPFVKLHCVESVDELFHRLSSLKDFTSSKSMIYVDDKRSPTSVFIDPQIYHYIDKITDLFSEESRMSAHICNNLSPIEYWKRNHAKIESVCKQKYGDVSLFHLRETVYEMVKMPTTFKTSYTKMLCDLFCHQGGIYLDPFAGWGDRCIGALASKKVRRYIGCDPNSNLVEPYKQIKKSISNRFRFFNLPFEDFYMKIKDSLKGKIDFVLTSPPFYDYEVYTNLKDKKQSIHQKWTYQQWLEEWYTPRFSELDTLLKKGSIIILYVGKTFKTPHLPEDTRKIFEDLKYEMISCISRVNGKASTETLIYRKME